MKTEKRVRITAMFLVLILALAMSMPMVAFASGTTANDGLGGFKVSSDGTVSMGSSGAVNTDTVLDKGTSVVRIILSVAALVCLAFLIISIAKFAKSGDNEMERRRALGGILTTGIGVALLGSVTIFYSYFFNLFKA